MRPDDELHPGVRYRIEATKNDPKPYLPKNLPEKVAAIC